GEDSPSHDPLPTFKTYPQIKPKFPPQLNPRDLIVTKKSQDESLPPIISRVPNAFIIYRKQFVKSAREQGYFLPMTVISSMASASWENEEEEVKLEYKRIAKEVLKCKKEMYPKISNRKRKDRWNIVQYRPRSLKNGGRGTSLKKEKEQNVIGANGKGNNTLGNEIDWSIYLTPSLSESTSSLSSLSSISSPTFGLAHQDHMISDVMLEFFNNSGCRNDKNDVTVSSGPLDFERLTPTSAYSSPVQSNDSAAVNRKGGAESSLNGSETHDTKRSRGDDDASQQSPIDLNNFEFTDDSERQKFEELYNSHQNLSDVGLDFGIPGEFLNLLPDDTVSGLNNEYFDSAYGEFNNMNNEFYNLHEDSFNNSYANENMDEHGTLGGDLNFHFSDSLGIYRHNDI
ncbi:11653_t:CDS:1, partial [Acaulospora colombiana]